MNYLAHAYLSFGQDDILLGNMISDFVKGRSQVDAYPTGIQKGIRIHRMIDSFTDAHPATASAKEVFRPAYRLYSGAFVDIVYDHFLAIEESEFTDKTLFTFAAETYASLQKQQYWMPEPFLKMFPFMQSQNWLYGYRTREGIGNSFYGLVRRAKYMDDSSAAVNIFNKEYVYLQACFKDFWKDIKSFVQNIHHDAI